jgi:predicted Zn finger-like uncharacterized protein
MLIVCPNCATSYEVEPAALGATGRSVRCVRCRNIWFARDPGPLAAIAEAHRADVAAFTGAEPESAQGGTHDGAPAAEFPITPAQVDAPPTQPPAEPWIEAPEQPAAAEPPYPEAGLRPRSEDGWPDPLPQARDPIAISDAPALAPMETGAALPADAKLPEDIETVAARREREAKGGSRWILSGLPLAILALLALNAALIGWRADVVRVAPQTASLYAAIGLPVNLRGLTFNDVTTTTESHEGVQVLVVEGTIASASPRVVEVPRLRFSVRNAGGQEVYAWTSLPTRSMLAPGETLTFRSRLASPPPDAREVLVRFFNRRDLVAGLQRSEGEGHKATH